MPDLLSLRTVGWGSAASVTQLLLSFRRIALYWCGGTSCVWGGEMDEVSVRSDLGGYRAIGKGFALVPSVSVVIPAKNEARNLEHVFATIPDWIDEIVLVDGHSTDDTIAVAEKLNPAVKIV